jgi:hypothetical protein
MKRIVHRGAVLSLFLAPCVAFGGETARYNCAFRLISDPVYIPAVATVTVDAPRWVGSISDPVSKKAMGGSVQAKIETQNSRRITLTWAQENMPPDRFAYPERGRVTRLYYKMTILADGSAKISADGRMTGRFEKTYSAIGTCNQV